MKNKITFATLATLASAGKAVLLVESLRRFGGRFSASPLIVLTPGHAGALPGNTLDRFRALGATLVPFDMREEVRQSPLAAVAYAAAAAEAQAKSQSGLLAWMLMDALILNPPEAFDLPAEIDFAYRPVHLTLLGSIFDRPPDAFWSALYRHCGVSQERLFPMQTCLRDHIIRPYFNAGLAVVRPALGLLGAWAEQFDRLVQHPDFVPFYEQGKLYAVFMHQAVLSAVIPGLLERQRMQELPENINYPLHLHADYPSEYRPKKLNDLITCRYEEVKVLQKIPDELPVDEPLKSWLSSHLS